MTMGRGGKDGARVGMFPPVTRQGGKRAVAAHVLEILGAWPTRWLLVDADVAIVEFWQAAFGGRLPAVAEIIRNAPCDGEELWKLWKDEPVPMHPDERVARWEVVQSGQAMGGPIVDLDGKWIRGRDGKTAEAPSFKYPPAGSKGFQAELLATANERLARWIVLQKLERRIGKNQRTWSKQRIEWATINWDPARSVHHSMAATRSFVVPSGPLFSGMVDLATDPSTLAPEAAQGWPTGSPGS